MAKGTNRKNHPLLLSIVVALSVGLLGALVFCSDTILRGYDTLGELLTRGLPNLAGSVLFYGVLFGVFLVYPAILTFINLVGLFCLPKNDTEYRTEKYFEAITLLLGLLFTSLYMSISNIRMDAVWSQQLVNDEIHQPIWTGAAVTILVLSLVGVIGYLILAWVALEKLPPLITVLSMSAMYLGMLICILWMVQTFDNLVINVLPVNCLIIGFKVIRFKIREWKRLQEKENKRDAVEETMEGEANQKAENESAHGQNEFLQWCNNILMRAELWPLLALILMIPLLGVLLAVLILFGQKPDAIIKAWTETADWRLSQQIAPQNVMYDEHYLCTVAAGGHEKVVKPLRMGERHGHRVVVNRQLCIANAFEQILEEKTPRFHRAVRHFYDTCGFPLSRVIKTKWAADVTYILMKPLEWIFLIVIYLCDVKPENRIAVQYLPRNAE